MKWQVGLYVAAVFLPLIAFTIQILFIRALGRLNAYIATGAIAGCFVLSLIGFGAYFLPRTGEVFAHHGAAHASESAGEEHAHKEAISDGSGKNAGAGMEDEHEHAEAAHTGPFAWTAGVDWVSLGGEVSDKAGAVPPLKIRLEAHIDNLTTIMFLMVTFIATLIHLYSMGYMHDDPRYPRFFAYLSLFCFSMLGLVISGNIFMIFLFWELVGVCSYLLIGFWYEDKKNCDAANKAFIVNRVGDVGMLMGLGLIWSSLGTFNINEINTSIRNADGQLNLAAGIDREPVVQLVNRETGKVMVDAATGRPRQITTLALMLAGLGVFAGCVGKSAQFPLQVWLPDAMAGPTPVSALIHAATMVAAGVYLVGRFFPLFTEDVLLYIAYTGGITLFIAATIAVVQTDYKKVLAYSTVSQLGFMMLGLGVGGWAAGLFHLLTHAFFKALLFLGAGSVYHSVHTYEMPVLGGLKRKMPITAYTMLIATLAISGVPFFSGFYSKDAILAASLYRVFVVPGGMKHILLFIFPAVGATITAFYMFRMWFLVFDGEPRGYPEGYEPPHEETHAPAVEDDHGHGHAHDHGHAPAHGHAPVAAAPLAAHVHAHAFHRNPVEHAHESEPIMTWPLIALAIPSVLVGWTWFFGLPVAEPVLEQMIQYGEPYRASDPESMHYYAMGASILIMLAGIGAGVAFYAPSVLELPPKLARVNPHLRRIPKRRFRPETWAERFPRVYSFLKHKWYFDELYHAAFVRNTLGTCLGLAIFDKQVVDGVVNTSAALTSLFSRIDGAFDRIFVDGTVNLVASLSYALGDYGRRIQTGRLRNYLMVLTVALIGLFAGVFVWVR